MKNCVFCAKFYDSPKNQEMCVQLEQTKQLALLLDQSRLKKVAKAVFSCA